MKGRKKPNFGKLVKAYDAMRPSYPDRVIKMVLEAIGGKTPLVLDIGCGTGISTRQLAQAGAFAIGCDNDKVMLDAAMGHKEKNVAYVLGDARNLPFRDGTFDGVTAFTAFHWFNDTRSVCELRRVLKSRGALCAVDPWYTTHFRRQGELRKILNKQFPHTEIPTHARRDNVKAIRSAGFKRVRLVVVKKTYKYTLDEFLTLVQSHSIWHKVPDGKERMILGVLRKYFRTQLKKGYIHDSADIKVILAKK